VSGRRRRVHGDLRAERRVDGAYERILMLFINVVSPINAGA
jgi:hypothetical protein